LIHAAKRLFAEKGFDGTTVKEIAEGAGMNISLISYHFQGKEGLYRACVEHFGKARLAIATRILKEPNSVEDFRIRLKMFMDEVLTLHVEEPEVSKIISRECDTSSPLTQDIFKETFLKIFETLVNFFKQAQQRGILKKDADMEIVAALCFGGLLHFAQKDHVSEMFFGKTIRNPKYRENLIDSALTFYLEGCGNTDTASQEEP